ncbi:MAG: exodeoxyribonuclease VII large subunit, partial [Candidatus Omnitrophica bacterium CG1_02_46_14]
MSIDRNDKKIIMNVSTLQTDRRIFSVSEITRNIRFILEENFSGVWVEGEVSNFKFHSSGHMYFALKDEASQIQCVMFHADNQKLKFELQEGLSVLCRGRVSVYPVRGQYQLYIERLEPKGTGALQIRFEQLKEKLRQEGFFDESHKKEIPYLPARIGVVTSIDGAALHDILNVLERRFSNVNVIIYPVPVQGIGAAESIAEAVKDFNHLNNADVLIVGRGGGSLEDLWAFNEEVVARAIYDSKIPVISAVGHEVDFTIADFVADLRAATPSAAAEIVLPLKEELLLRPAELKARMCQAILRKLKFLKQELKQLTDRQGLRNPLGIFEIQFQKCDELKKNCDSLIETFLKI